jgi:hypothetical protein
LEENCGAATAGKEVFHVFYLVENQANPPVVHKLLTISLRSTGFQRESAAANEGQTLFADIQKIQVPHHE